MSESLRNLRTKLSRAVDLAGGSDLPAAVTAVGPLLRDATTGFFAADKAVRAAAVAFGKEAPEAQAATDTLGKKFDTTREVVSARLPGYPDPGPFSAHTTPTETLEAAIAMADLLADQNEPWAETLAAELAIPIESATKELDEKTDAGQVLQKSQADRAVAAEHAREVLQKFRRVIRSVHGSTSRQYHSLRDRITSRTEDDPAPPTAAS